MESFSVQTQKPVSPVSAGGCKCAGQRKSPGKAKCSSLTVGTPVHKPDLAIYSQIEALQKGIVPDWDSPDISTNLWRPFRLMEEARVIVRNLSPSIPAINALVHYSISPFGIGTKKEYKLSKTVSLPPNGQVELLFPLDQPTLKGDVRVGVHIDIEHPHDGNTLNNSGSQVHDGGYTTESGRNFSIQVPVYNDSNFSREIQLAIMPTELIASVNVARQVFAPHEQRIVTLHIEVPDFLRGTPAASLNRSVTLVGRLADGQLIGGVTRLVWIDN